MTHHHHQHEEGGRRISLARVRAELGTLAYARVLWSSPISRFVVDLVDPGPFQRVADVGAGLGPAVVVAAPRMPGGEVIAVDPATFMRAVLGLRRRWQRSRERIDVRSGTAEELPISDRSLDALWAVNAMHHFDDLAAACREAHRVLKPGGRLVYVDEDFEHEDHPLGGFDVHHSGDHGLPAVDVDDVADLLAEAGFVEVAADHREIAGIPVELVTATAGPAGVGEAATS